MRLVAITGKISQLIAIQPELCKIVPARKETAAVVAKAESEQADGEGNPGGIGRELLTDQPAERHHDRRAGAAQCLGGGEDGHVSAGDRLISHEDLREGGRAGTNRCFARYLARVW